MKHTLSVENSLLALDALSYLHFCRVKLEDMFTLETMFHIHADTDDGLRSVWYQMPKPLFFYQKFTDYSKSLPTVS